MKIKDTIPVIIGAVIALLLGFTYTANSPSSPAVGGGLGTIDQLSQWFFDGVNITQSTPSTPIKLTGLESEDCIGTSATGVLQSGTCTGGGGSGLATTSIDTEAELEAILTDVTNVYTNNDGNLNDDNLSDNTTSDLTEGTNLYYTVSRIQSALTAGYNAIFGNSTSTNQAVTGNFSFGGVTGSAWSTFCTAITGGAGLCDGTDATGGGGSGIATSTTPTPGQIPYWTSTSELGSIATGTLTESVTGLQFDQTRGLVGGSAVLSLSSGFAIPSSTDFTNWNLAYASTTALTPTYIRGLFSNTATGLTYTSATGLTALTAGYNIPLSASTTEWSGFYNTPSTRITAGTNLSWSGNTLNASGGGSGTTTATSSWTVCSLSNCDYVTDGTADEVQINQALSRASSTGGVVQLFAQNYNLASPILLSGLATEGDGNPEIKLVGMGREATKLVAGTNVNAIEIRNRAKYDISKVTININGTGTGIKGIAGTERGNWQSNINDVYIVGDFSTMASTSWGIDLQSPFRMRITNVEMNGVANGANLSSHTDSFNPGNLTVDRMFIDLWDNAANANATAFKLAVATTSSTGVNNLVSINRLDIAGGTNLTNSIGVHILGSISSYGDSRHHSFNSMNIEDVKTAYKFERARDNTLTNLNYTRVLGGGTIISLDSSSHNNFFENLYAVAQGSGQTFNLITDSNSSSNLPNRLARVDGFQPGSVTINATLAANTILEHIDLSGGSPTISSTITNRNNNRTFAGLTVTGTSTLATTTATRFSISSLISCDSLDTDSNGYIVCGTDATGGGSGGGLSTTSPWTNGNLAYVTGLGTVGSVATGTLTETVTGLEFNATRALVGGSAILAITSGYEIPLSASTTNWQSFYTTPSTRITAGANCSWVGNTFNCEGGGGGALSTTTDIVGDGGLQAASYVTGDVMFGGSSSTTAEFQFDDDGAKLIISSTSNAYATATVESSNLAQAVRIGDDDGTGIEFLFATAGKAIIKAYNAIISLFVNDITVSSHIALTSTSTPSAATSTLNIFKREIAGRGFLAQQGASGLDTALQPLLARNKVGYWNPPGNGTTVPGVFGFTAPTVTGFTATARNVATTNQFTRYRRLGYVTAATAGTVGQWRVNNQQYTVGDSSTNLGGFTYIVRFGISDAAAISDARMFMGMRSSATPTNVEPSTLTNAIGMCSGAADTNFKICYGGSSAQTPIDLGSSFPSNTRSTDMYELALFSSSYTGDINYEVTRLSTGDTATGTISNTSSTVLPTNTTLIGPWGYRTNNATALAAGMDVASAYIETDY